MLGLTQSRRTLVATHAASVISDHSLFLEHDILSRHKLLVPAIPLAEALRSADWGSTIPLPDKQGAATTTDAAAEHCFRTWYKGGYQYDCRGCTPKMDPETVAAA